MGGCSSSQNKTGKPIHPFEYKTINKLEIDSKQNNGDINSELEIPKLTSMDQFVQFQLSENYNVMLKQKVQQQAIKNNLAYLHSLGLDHKLQIYFALKDKIRQFGISFDQNMITRLQTIKQKMKNTENNVVYSRDEFLECIDQIVVYSVLTVHRQLDQRYLDQNSYGQSQLVQRMKEKMIIQTVPNKMKQLEQKLEQMMDNYQEQKQNDTYQSCYSLGIAMDENNDMNDRLDIIATTTKRNDFVILNSQNKQAVREVQNQSNVEQRSTDKKESIKDNTEQMVQIEQKDIAQDSQQVIDKQMSEKDQQQQQVDDNDQQQQNDDQQKDDQQQQDNDQQKDDQQQQVDNQQKNNDQQQQVDNQQKDDQKSQQNNDQQNDVQEVRQQNDSNNIQKDDIDQKSNN